MTDYYSQRISIEREKQESRERSERKRLDLEERKLKQQENKERERQRREDARVQERAYQNQIRAQEQEKKRFDDYQMHAENLLLRDKHFRSTIQDGIDRDEFQANVKLELQRRKEALEREKFHYERQSKIHAEQIHQDGQKESQELQFFLDLKKETFLEGFKQTQHHRDIFLTTHQVVDKTFELVVSGLVQKSVARENAKLEFSRLRTQEFMNQKSHEREIKSQTHAHKLEMERMQKKHAQEIAKLHLESELKNKNFTHDQVVQLVIRVMEQALLHYDKEIDRKQVAMWVREFEKDF